MKTRFFFSLYLLIVALTTFSCRKTDTKPDNNSTADPFFSYTIYNRLIGINCSDISFTAKPGDVMVGIFATHVSSKVSFNFAFPAYSSALEAAGTGKFPIAAYPGFSDASNLTPFQLSVKLPSKPNETDFYLSTVPASSDHVNNVTKIQKGGIENNKQVYWVEGNFTAPTENGDKQTTTISGQYRLKLLTLIQ